MNREFFKECSCDYIYYNIYEPLAIKIGDFLGKKGIDPNQVSIFRAGLFIIAGYLLYYLSTNLVFSPIISSIIISAILFIQWVLDDVDGYIARKFDMKSELGAKLDYWIDIICTVTFIAIIYYLLYQKNIYVALVVVLAIIILHWVHSKVVKNRKENNGKKICEPTWLNIVTNIHVLLILAVFITLYFY